MPNTNKPKTMQAILRHIRDKQLAIDYNKRNNVIEELTVKGAALGFIYGSMFIFIELFIIQVFGDQKQHFISMHNGILLGSMVASLTTCGLLLGILARYWDSRHPPLPINDEHLHHHRPKNPYRKAFNVFPWILLILSSKFDFLQTHEQHVADVPPTPNIPSISVEDGFSLDELKAYDEDDSSALRSSLYNQRQQTPSVKKHIDAENKPLLQIPVTHQYGALPQEQTETAEKSFSSFLLPNV